MNGNEGERITELNADFSEVIQFVFLFMSFSGQNLNPWTQNGKKYIYRSIGRRLSPFLNDKPTGKLLSQCCQKQIVIGKVIELYVMYRDCLF